MSVRRLPEIREADATPDIVEVYADIRRCMRLPFVNLIYRHLATMPGVLPEIWDIVRVMVLSGQLDTAMGRLRQKLPVFEVDLGTTGDDLEGDDRLSIRRVLQAYNRGNGLNLIALTAIRQIAHTSQHGLVRIDEDPTRYQEPPLPALIKLNDLDVEMSRQVKSIALLHGGGPGVVPSLYLHLANWPQFLLVACSGIRPWLEDGSIKRCSEAAVGYADEEARHILSNLANDAPAPPIPKCALAALERFTAAVIPEMLPVGIALETALLQQANS